MKCQGSKYKMKGVSKEKRKQRDLIVRSKSKGAPKNVM